MNPNLPDLRDVVIPPGHGARFERALESLKGTKKPARKAPGLFIPKAMAHRGIDGYDVHHTERYDTHTGSGIIQIIDYEEGDDPHKRAGLQHVVEDTVGNVSGDNELAKREGERAREKRDGGWTRFKEWARHAARIEVLSKKPVFHVYDDEYGNPYLVHSVFNLDTERHEVVGGRIGEDGSVRETWAIEVARDLSATERMAMGLTKR